MTALAARWRYVGAHRAHQVRRENLAAGLLAIGVPVIAAIGVAWPLAIH